MSSYWQKEDVFLDGDQYFDFLLRDIDSAQKLITIEIYIFNDDIVGKRITQHLIAAHKRGVEVQIIVDGVGSYSFFDRLYGEFEKHGIIVKMFHPLPILHPFYGNLSFKQKVSAFFTRIWRMNQRNHRKIITLDSHTMYVSSYNFTIEHTQDYAQQKWKDMGVRVEGEHVKLAVLNFKKIWQLKEYLKMRQEIKPLLKHAKHSPLRMSSSMFMKRFLYRDLLQRIYKAENRIWLVTPYFIPKGRLILALGKAAKRGVDVRILISKQTDVRLFRTLQFFYYPYLLKKKVKVFQYNKTILHAKNFIIDDFITIGSSNLNHRSLLHDLEVDLSIQKQINKETISKDFIHSADPELEITLEHLKQRTLFDTFLSRLFFVFKYWF
jgi:cardiolipin synthase